MTSRVAECKQYSPDAFKALEGLKIEDSTNPLLKASQVPQESWPAYDRQASVRIKRIKHVTWDEDIRNSEP